MCTNLPYYHLVCFTICLQQCANASQTLCDMIRLSRESEQMAGPIPLLGTLERYKYVKCIFVQYSALSSVYTHVLFSTCSTPTYIFV